MMLPGKAILARNNRMTIPRPHKKMKHVLHGLLISMDTKTIVAMFTSVALAASSLLPTKTSKRCNTCLVFSRAPAIILWFWWCKDSLEHRLRFSLKLANGAIHATFSDRWVGSCLCKFWLPNTTAAILRTCAKMKDVLYRLLFFCKKWCCLARPS